MDPSKVSFHDGSLDSIKISGKSLALLLQSAEIPAPHSSENLSCSHNLQGKPEFTLRGKLHLEGITDLEWDGTKVSISSIKMGGETSSILEFELQEHELKLLVEWIGFPPFDEIKNPVSQIKIQFQTYFWENLPIPTPKPEGLLARLKNYRRNTPEMQDEYYVIDSGDTVLAILSNPKSTDQFWTEFKLTPVIEEDENSFLYRRLYTDSFWISNRISFCEKTSGKRVTFLIRLELDDDDHFVEAFKPHATHVVLRGPYFPDDPNSS